MEAHSLVRPRGGLALPRSRKLLAPFGDERLVEQLRRGNEVAFEVLYDRHHRGVLSYCRHMLGTRDEAEDALQQAFVSAHADIVSSQKPIRFKAWIYTIARNRCLSILRARREQPSDDLEPVSTAGLGDQVQQRADLQELLGDMQELPHDQRAALILSELGDLSHAEVAEVIGCEAAKVKSLVFQARSGLMERRQARETPCEEIREQLSTLRGGALRRGPLRRHLAACSACQEFREEVRRQRQMVAVILPVIPTLGLKESALAAAGVGAASGGGGMLAGVGSGGLFAAKAGAAKIAVVAVATGSAVGGGIAVQQGAGDSSSPARSASQPAAAGAGSGAEIRGTGADVLPGVRLGPGDGRGFAEGGRNEAARDGARREERSRGTERRPQRGSNAPRSKSDGGKSDGRKNGFTPAGGPNGERAREFARGRGKGRKRGLQRERANPPSRANAGQRQGQGRSEPRRRAQPQRPVERPQRRPDSRPAPLGEAPVPRQGLQPPAPLGSSQRSRDAKPRPAPLRSDRAEKTSDGA